MIDRFVNIIAEDLEIKPLPVVVDPAQLWTDTQLAAVKEGKIYLRSGEFTPDLAFALAHELRHVWQLDCDPDFYFKDYKELSKENDLTAYNLQQAEVDANAYAAIIMEDLIGLRPLWNGLPAVVVKAIKEREEQILDME